MKDDADYKLHIDITIERRKKPNLFRVEKPPLRNISLSLKQEPVPHGKEPLTRLAGCLGSRY